MPAGVRSLGATGMNTTGIRVYADTSVYGGVLDEE